MSLRAHILASGAGAGELLNDASYVGGKAVGLLRLPVGWVPPFVVLTRAFRDLVLERGGVASALQALSEHEIGTFDNLLHDARDAVDNSSQTGLLLVRSNGAHEKLSDRGTYQSYSVPPARDEVANAIEAVMYSGGADMFVIVQRAVEPGLLGHLSNERRVTPDPKRWLVEGLHRGTDLQQTFVSARKSFQQVEALHARSEKEVTRELRRVASRLLHVGLGQHHCEWVWDGQRVWIVQCDDASSHQHPSNGDLDPDANSFLVSTEARAPRFDPRSELLHFRDVPPGIWSKLERPKVFSEINFPTADVYLVSGDTWADSTKRSAIVDDLSRMCQHPVVIRCDVRKGWHKDDVLLPTSKSSKKSSELAAFMDTVSAQFRAKGLAPQQWAFLPAFLVPARASAMVHSFPNAQRVRVDTLWGYPDGLLHYAHDSWFYYPQGNRITREIRFKGECLLPEGHGWITRRVGPPLDWDSVLNEDEVRTLSQWGLRLANRLNTEVQLMALARIGGERGSAACLPWHYTTFQLPQYAQALRAPSGLTGIEVVRNLADLSRLRGKSHERSIRGYHLDPDRVLLRDETFLEQAAALAASHGKPVYFEGSVLGHAYYALARAGATLIPVSTEPLDDPKVYRKLVRDQIPMIIRQAGGLARVRRIPRSEAKEMLAQKLIEEAFEVRNASGQDVAEELADVLDVVDAIRDYAGVSQAELAELREKKRSNRGGFEDLVYLQETSIRPMKIGTETRGLPLFGEDALPPTRHTARSARHTEPERVSAQNELLRFSVSLVPPSGGNEDSRLVEANPESLLRSGDSDGVRRLNVRMNVRYTGSRAEIQVIPVASGESANQMLLPFADQTEAVRSRGQM
jgi:predicted house-cleaning noncanonical NTP pyrophosphatase (MazG superfamily)